MLGAARADRFAVLAFWAGVAAGRSSDRVQSAGVQNWHEPSAREMDARSPLRARSRNRTACCGKSLPIPMPPI